MNFSMAVENLYWNSAKKFIPGGTDINGVIKEPPVPGTNEVVADGIHGGWFVFNKSRLMKEGALMLRVLYSMPRQIRSSVSDKGIPWVLCRNLKDLDAVLDSETLVHVLAMAQAMGFLKYLGNDTAWTDIRSVQVDDVSLVRKEKVKDGKKWSLLMHAWK